MYSDSTNPSYRMLKHKKLVAQYYKKFQKYEKALEVLMNVYKAERKIYNDSAKQSEQIEPIVEENLEKSTKEEQPAAEGENKVEEIEQDDKEPIVENEEASPTDTQAYIVTDTPLAKKVREIKKSRNINVRLAITMIEIMNIYSSKREKQKAKRFQEEAEKYMLEGVDGNKEHILMCKCKSSSGDMFVKYGGTKNIDFAYKYYEEANKALENTVGKKSIDFLLSMVDIGDTYLERKSYQEAEAFYKFCKSQIEEYHGTDCIFKHRINSALVEVYSSMGGENRNKGYD